MIQEDVRCICPKTYMANATKSLTGMSLFVFGVITFVLRTATTDDMVDAVAIPSRSLLVVSGLLAIVCHETLAIAPISGLDRKVYAKRGDLNIGFTTSVYGYSSSEFCSSEYSESGAQITELPAFMTELINADDSLLPNVSLGFVAFDDCENDLTALARSISFLPPGGEVGEYDDPYRVVGVVGPSNSDQSVMIASLLGLFRIPVLSPHSTSDVLSDESRFPYFLRLMLSDIHQAAAVVDVIRYFGWSYVSVLYSEGNYERDIAQRVEKLLANSAICLAAFEMIGSNSAEFDIEWAINGMREKEDTHVVILFLQNTELRTLFTHVKRRGLAKRFFWVSGENLALAPDWHMEDIVDGSLYVGYPDKSMPHFRDYLRGLSWRNSTNPWLHLVFESLYNCSWPDGDDDVERAHNNDDTRHSCRQYDTLEQVTHPHWSAPVRQADGFLVYAKALHSLIEDHCPEMFQKIGQKNFDRCISGSLLLDYMKNVSFVGHCGYVMFDRKGDLKLNTVVIQMKRDAPEGHQVVGEWDSRLNSLRVNGTALDWGEVWNLARTGVQSVCSQPCGVGQVYQLRKVVCCWDCIPCRDNEITVRNSSGCESCPDFMWPDGGTRLRCWPVEPYYLRADSVTGATVIALSAFGALLSLVFIVVYLAKAGERLLKASSKKLSILTLVGCMLTSVMAASFVSRPDMTGCRLRLGGFHLGVCVMYSPLVAKTSRLYRIFRAGKTGTSQPRFVSNKAQLVLTATIIVIQVTK